MRTYINIPATLLYIIFFGFMPCSAEVIPVGAETVRVACYKDAFTAERTGRTAWACYWNAPPSGVVKNSSLDAPSGRIGEANGYRRLEKVDDEWFGPNGLRLSSQGGTPGAGADKESATFERYVIVAYTVECAGLYSIGASRLRRIAADGDAIDIVVHANAYRPVLREFCQPGQEIDFDTEVGHLQAGSVIYVAIGPGATSASDTFELDFAIDRRDIPGVREQIELGIAENRFPIRLIPGRYYVPSGAGIELEGLADFDIDARGVTLIAPPGTAAVSVTNCSRGRLRGLVIDLDPLPITQGQIIAMDPGREWLDLRIDAFYPPPNGQTGRNMIFEAATLRQKRPAASYNFMAIERMGTDTFRLLFEKAGIPEELAVNDLLAIPAASGPNALSSFECDAIRFEGITIHSSASSGLTEQRCSANVYKELKLTRGPRNPLASRDRLRTCMAAGFHSRQPRVGPKVLDSLFEWMGDDGLAIDGHWGVVLESSGERIHLAVRSDEPLEVGEPLRFYRWDDHSQARGTVAAFDTSRFKSADAVQIVKDHYPAFKRPDSYEYTCRVTLQDKKEPALKPGDLVSFPARNGEGFEFRNNIIRGGRSRGMNIKAGGIVDGNRFEDLQKPGILVYAAYGHTSMEAQFVDGLIISNNLIEDCVFLKVPKNALRYCGGIVVTGNRNTWGHNGHRNIRIENNTIRGVYRGVNMSISNATNIVLKGNRFYDTHRHPGGGGDELGVDNQAVVWMDRVDGVVIEDCSVEGLGPYGDPDKALVLTDNARNVTGNLSVE